MDEYKEKELFVRTGLKPMLLMADKRITNAEYKLGDNWEAVQGNFRSEFVEVTYTNGQIKLCDVTFDNLKAIARDVLSQI